MHYLLNNNSNNNNNTNVNVHIIFSVADGCTNTVAFILQVCGTVAVIKKYVQNQLQFILLYKCTIF